ncbi:MAG: protein phosphatase 2C domain-containing protein [Firmicutes bacterium]|nr:protein phosphatase 2C domain-containing protein [Bacillota bacterium]
MTWKVVHASVAGRHRAPRPTSNQDHYQVRLIHDPEGNPLLVALLCDGAGGVAFGGEGSALACLLLARDLTRFFHRHRLAALSRSWVEDWIHRFRDLLWEVGERHGASPVHFATTLVGCVAGEDAAAFFQVGDGAMVVRSPGSPGRYGAVFWPEQGEYAHTTAFVTDPDCVRHLQFATAGPIDELALFSDGLQRLALDWTRLAPHAPLFQQLFADLRRLPSPEPEGNQALERLLRSEPVASRTDDDRTLILAIRRGVDAP